MNSKSDNKEENMEKVKHYLEKNKEHVFNALLETDNLQHEDFADVLSNVFQKDNFLILEHSNARIPFFA